MVYEIVVAGPAEHLVRVALGEPRLRHLIGGVAITVEPRDQAELVGIVNRLHDVGLEIVDVRRLVPSS